MCRYSIKFPACHWHCFPCLICVAFFEFIRIYTHTLHSFIIMKSARESAFAEWIALANHCVCCFLLDCRWMDICKCATILMCTSVCTPALMVRFFPCLILSHPFHMHAHLHNFFIWMTSFFPFCLFVNIDRQACIFRFSLLSLHIRAFWQWHCYFAPDADCTRTSS